MEHDNDNNEDETFFLNIFRKCKIFQIFKSKILFQKTKFHNL